MKRYSGNKKTTITLPVELAAFIRQEAKRNMRSFNGQLVFFLASAVGRSSMKEEHENV